MAVVQWYEPELFTHPFVSLGNKKFKTTASVAIDFIFPVTLC